MVQYITPILVCGKIHTTCRDVRFNIFILKHSWEYLHGYFVTSSKKNQLVAKITDGYIKLTSTVQTSNKAAQQTS